MNNRQKMRNSHHKVIEWLLNNGFDFIHVVNHGSIKNQSYIYSKKVLTDSKGQIHLTKWTKTKFPVYNVRATDIWNVADMFCIEVATGRPFLIQVKTSGSLATVNETAKLGLFSKYRGLENHVKFMSCKPTKNRKFKVDYRIL